MVENLRANQRIHGTKNPALGQMQVGLLKVAREIMAHAEARLASLLENGKASGNGHVVSGDENGNCESDRTRATNTTAKDYSWRPDDVLCAVCFRATFSGLYYAWWLEERQTDRVEGELLSFNDQPATVLSDGCTAHTFAEGRCQMREVCIFQRKREHAALKDVSPFGPLTCMPTHVFFVALPPAYGL
jgi:hypothetical protein